MFPKIMEKIEFNFREEDYIKYVTKIGKLVLTTMTYEINNGKVMENPLNEKERNMNNQEAPIKLDNFDYSIPQLPLTEYLLKVLIANINVINYKIYFITRHFISDPTQLPQDMFFDDFI